MILYVDTSALVPLLIEETTSDDCGKLWDVADRVIATRLAYVEAAAALAMGERMGRISGPEHAAGRDSLVALWPIVAVVELDAPLMDSAAMMADTHDLRGYDAVHCAAATAVAGPDVVAAAGDARLLEAWRQEGVAAIDAKR